MSRRHPAGMRHLLILFLPLVSGDGYGATVDGGGGVRAKGKSADPPRLGRFQQSGDKGETTVILFIVFTVGLGVYGKGWRWVLKQYPYI